MAATHSPRIVQLPAGRVLVFDSATYVEDYVKAHPETAGDVLVNASYSGVLCARMVMSARPKAVIGLDCAIGKDGAGIAGLGQTSASQVAGYGAQNATNAGNNAMQAGNAAASGYIGRANAVQNGLQNQQSMYTLNRLFPQVPGG